MSMKLRNWLEINQVAHELIGTCLSVEQALEQLEINASPDEVEDQMADANIELCPECEYWVESGELAGEEGENQSCSGCRGEAV